MNNKRLASVFLLLLCQSCLLIAGNALAKRAERKKQKLISEDFIDAALDGETHILRDMISTGATISQTTKRIALGAAIYSGKPETVKFLVRQGASVIHKDPRTKLLPINQALAGMNYHGHHSQQILTFLLDHHPSRDTVKETVSSWADETDVKDTVVHIETTINIAAGLILTEEHNFDPPLADIVQGYLSRHRGSAWQQANTRAVLKLYGMIIP